ncbi:MAG: hypothetical protein Q8936_24355 [Bacillota bacterium]|nr:hypothetical protein [Bacillota bacterium]
MAGGFKQFGPTYKTTDILRLGYEGYLNGTHDISAELVANAMAAVGNPSVAGSTPNENLEPNVELCGKIAAMKADGVGLAGDKGAGAIGLFREDLHDMVNASLKATFYFRGGEYYVQETRVNMKDPIAIGDKLTSDADGKIRKVASGETDAVVIGVCTHVGPYTAGNMYTWAGDAANGGDYIGFIMYI